jgi:hypothetical protein
MIKVKIQNLVKIFKYTNLNDVKIKPGELIFLGFETFLIWLNIF